MDEMTAVLLGLIRSGHASSRADLVRESGYARVTVTRRLEKLLTSGLVAEVGSVQEARGRPTIQLGLNADRGALLGADIGGSHARVAVLNLAGQILQVVDRDIDINAGPDAILGMVADQFTRLLQERQLTGADAWGIGIGLPGPVEQATGQVVSPPTMRGWDGADIPRFFASRFDAPVAVDKDANIMALGEFHALAEPVRDMLMLKIGMGIGAGIIAHGRILRGGQGAAGDLGHLPRPGGARCRCGQEGCAEATAGGWALAHELRARGFTQVHSSQDVLTLAQTREAAVLDLLGHAGRRLGEVLADAIGVLNPSLVIVAGNLAPAGEELIGAIRERIYELSHPLATKKLQIRLGALGADAGLLGAGRIAADAAFSGERVAALVN
ncbi:MAG: ROK family protein [Beutenbergiaceae bacterium]